VRAFSQCPFEPEVTYLGVDTEHFRPAESRSAARARLRLPKSGVCIATVCRLHRDKGVGHLISAFERLCSSAGDAWILIVGDGPAKEELEAQAERLGVRPRVFFVGPQPHADVRNWLQAADVFVLPSRKEGLPNSILEAMAAGLPVVATDVGGIGEAVTRSCGRLVPYSDVPALAEALRRLIDSPELRSSQGQAARSRAVETFGWAASAARLIGVYRSVLGESEPHD
jgi:glycosyltransferase involved in cell wall biosynthesis